MSVMVTGGTGFVGINMVKYLAQKGIDAVCLGRSAHKEDPLRDWFLEDVQDRVHLVRGDVTDPDLLKDVVKKYDVRQIVHTAAITPDAEVQRNRSSLVLDVNINGTATLLNVVRDMELDRFVYTSSAAVVLPNSELIPLDEYCPLDLTSGLYPITKYASEQLCELYTKAYGVDAVSARLGWIYGPMERPVDARSGMSEVYNIIHNVLAGKKIITNDLERYRDWTHAMDVALGLDALLEADSLFEPMYNVTCGQSWSGHQMMAMLRDLLGDFDVEVTEDRSQVNVPVNSANRRGPLGIARLTHDTGFTPQIPIEEGLASYVEWVKKSQELFPNG